MSVTSTRPTSAGLTGRQKAGLVLAVVLDVVNLPSIFEGAPDGEVEPPFGILLLCTILAVAGLVATVLAWRGSALATRISAGCLVALALAGLPAFFVDVPMAIKVVVAVSVLLTVLAVVLMFSGRRSDPLS